VTAQGYLQVDQTFNFSSTNMVDILVVDDNSGSMTTEQENLGNALNGFVGNLQGKGLDWRIAVTNTDTCESASGQPAGFCPGPSGIAGADGQFMNVLGTTPIYGPNIITPGTPNAAQVFHDTIQRGNQVGSGDERGIYAVNLAIDSRSSSGFFRDGAGIAVVILSDEDERSTGGNCTEVDPTFPNQYSSFSPGQCDAGFAPLENYDQPTTLVSKVQQAWGGAKPLLVNSIIIQPNDMTQYPDPNMGGAMQTCLQLQSHQGPYYTAHPGRTYQQLSQMTGGVVGSICNNVPAGSGQGAFTAMLGNISGAIINLPSSNVVTLAYSPNATPTVTFSPAGNAVPWTWSGNQITFSKRPASGTTVDVNYTYKP